MDGPGNRKNLCLTKRIVTMEELFVSDNELKNLIKTEGLLTAPPESTARIMEIIATEVNKPASAYKPLLGKKAWVLLTSGAILLTALSWIVLSTTGGTGLLIPDFVNPLTANLQRIDFSINISNHTLQLIAFAMANIGLLVGFDLWLNHKHRKYNI